MSDVFISYSHGDQAYARRLADDMRRHGLDVWIDERIGHGEHWFASIEQAITGSRAVVVIMTPEAEVSEWVAKEILLAKRERKPIYPVLLRGREFAILIDLQFANVIGGKLPPDDFYARLAGATPVAARRPAASGNSSRVVSIAVAALALVAVAVFALAGAGVIPRFWAGAPPTDTLPPPTFPSLDGTYMPPIDVGQIDPNAFPGPSPIPLGGNLNPPTVADKGETQALYAASSIFASYLALVVQNRLDEADLYICPAKRNNVTVSLRQMMDEQNISDIVNVACRSYEDNMLSCDYTLVFGDGQHVPQTDSIYLESGLIC